ncbi:tRNA 2'-phosphotransferase 1 isoform X3 [Microtus pennsylvanicus]|uniref:tRNA 2'-phosphotransferase 1 isoform X3 n=1 Tax=Microtus pennsylvanicus TaxID=10058 RepID=UPI003F6CE7DE
MNAPGGRRQEGRRAHRPREQDRDVQLSKALSYVLRHGALKLGLPMRAVGADAPGDTTSPASDASPRHILEALAIYSTEGLVMPRKGAHPLGLRIAWGPWCHQWSVSPSPIYPPRSPTKGHNFLCVRLLPRLAWSSTSLLHPRAPFCPNASGSSLDVPTGMRPNCDVAVFIDGPLALADGIPFFRSANGVILTPGDAEGFLLPKYFKEALQLRPTPTVVSTSGKPLPLAGDKETEHQSGPKHSSRGGGRKIQQ